MRGPLIVGLLIGALASYHGVFVVQRGLSFLGDGLAHAAFGGVALGLLLGIEPLWVAAPFTALIAVAIIWAQDRTGVAGDTAIGVFFALSMALGVIFISMRHDYTQDAFAYLFGSILSVQKNDIYLTAVVTAASALTWPAWGRWAYATFDRELAQADHIRVRRDDYILSVSISIAVVIAVKLIGIALIAAFLVIPAATARLVSRTFFGMTLVAQAFGALSVVVGLGLSYMFDQPSGPMIILIQASLFFGAVGFRAARPA